MNKRNILIYGTFSAVMTLVGYLLPQWLMPIGRPIPQAPPSEANRVIHPDGFSIVKPPDWHASVGPEVDPPYLWQSYSAWISLSAGDFRYPDTIGAYRRKVPGDIRSFPVNSTFQDEPAYRRISQVTKGVEWPYFDLELVFERQGQVFEIHYRRRANPPPSQISPEIWRYLETFRYDLPKAGRTQCHRSYAVVFACPSIPRESGMAQGARATD